MKFIKNYLNRNGNNTIAVEKISNSRPHLQTETEIRFTVHSANGGKVIQFQRYDHKRDEQYTSLHIITNDDDFGNTIDKILTIEGLRS